MKQDILLTKMQKSFHREQLKNLFVQGHFLCHLLIHCNERLQYVKSAGRELLALLLVLELLGVGPLPAAADGIVAASGRSAERSSV